MSLSLVIKHDFNRAQRKDTFILAFFKEILQLVIKFTDMQLISSRSEGIVQQ